MGSIWGKHHLLVRPQDWKFVSTQNLQTDVCLIPRTKTSNNTSIRCYIKKCHITKNFNNQIQIHFLKCKLLFRISPRIPQNTSPKILGITIILFCQVPCSSVALPSLLNENQGLNPHSPTCCNNWIKKKKSIILIMSCIKHILLHMPWKLMCKLLNTKQKKKSN